MSPAPILVPPLAEPAADAVEQLHEAIAALPPWAVPCVADGHGRDWTSDHPAAIDRAIAGCSSCPVLAQCEAFGVATRADGVVLAGRRWAKHTAKNLRARGSDTSPASAGTEERKTSA